MNIEHSINTFLVLTVCCSDSSNVVFSIKLYDCIIHFRSPDAKIMVIIKHHQTVVFFPRENVPYYSPVKIPRGHMAAGIILKIPRFIVL